MFERELVLIKSYIDDLDKRAAYSSEKELKSISYFKYSAEIVLSHLLDEESELPIYIPDRMPYSSIEIVENWIGELSEYRSLAAGEESKETFYYLELGAENVLRLLKGEEIEEELYRCQDVFSGRYFRSNVSRIKKGLEEANKILEENGRVALNSYYSYIGLAGIKIGYNFDWEYPECHEIKLDFTTGKSEDGRYCLFVDFQTYPKQNYEPWGM